MPGVLQSHSHGFSREVGKMAFLMHPDITLNDVVVRDHTDYYDFLDVSSQFLIDSADSEGDLPDNEHPVDLIKFLDSPDQDLDHHLHYNFAEGCTSCIRKYTPVSSQQDPFMGMGSFEKARPGTNVSILGQPVAIDYDSGSEELPRQKVWDTKTFSAWNAPKTEDEHDLMPSKGFVSWNSVLDDDTSDLAFPDTPSPSAQSGNNTGDDSDVDIETITDAPRSADSCGYVTQDSSPSISPSTSPEPVWTSIGGLSISLPKSATTSSHYSTLRMKSSTIRSSSTSLLVHRNSVLGQKRKLSKERKLASKVHVQPAYAHVLCNNNSVNFHDYAMSPGACTIYPTLTETARPTVLSKRIYKRLATVDASGKEKQHHHNQLERNRRQKLADLFVDLRDEVPKISSQPKASKVLILNEATVYIRELQRLDKQQEDELFREQRKTDLLKKQLRHLQTKTSCSSVK